VLGVVLLYNPIGKYLDPLNTGSSGFDVEKARSAGFEDTEIASYLRTRVTMVFLKVGIAPPAITLIFVTGAGWVVRGFQTPKG
jgi:hypothetical protein